MFNYNYTFRTILFVLIKSIYTSESRPVMVNKDSRTLFYEFIEFKADSRNNVDYVLKWMATKLILVKSINVYVNIN